MSNFEDSGSIVLQPNDLIGFEFEFNAATVPGGKGGIPYGRTIASHTEVVYDNDTGTDVTSDIMDGTATISGEIITVIFKYPVVNTNGRYKITFFLVLDNGWVRQKDFDLIYARTN